MIRERYRARIGVVAAGLLVLVAAVGRAEAGATYDAVNDFSITSNPNGPWSYGSLSALSGGTFSALTSTIINSNYTGQEAWYNGQSIPNAIAVDKNTSGSTVNYETITQPTTVLRLDGESGIADVRWIAPTTGVYNISGYFLRIDDGNTPVSVRVLENGSAIFSADSFSTFNTSKTFGFTSLSLAAGTVLDFAEGAPQYYNDSTGLAVTITNIVPEPSSLALLGLGIAGPGLGLFRRLKRAA